MSITTGCRQGIQNLWHHIANRCDQGTAPVRTALSCTALLVSLSAGFPQQAEAAESTARLYLESKVNSQPPSGAQQLCAKYEWACAVSGGQSRITRQHLSLIHI